MDIDIKGVEPDTRMVPTNTRLRKDLKRRLDKWLGQNPHCSITYVVNEAVRDFLDKKEAA